jgi:hypothetical protein
MPAWLPEAAYLPSPCGCLPNCQNVAAFLPASLPLPACLPAAACLSACLLRASACFPAWQPSASCLHANLRLHASLPGSRRQADSHWHAGRQPQACRQAGAGRQACSRKQPQAGSRKDCRQGAASSRRQAGSRRQPQAAADLQVAAWSRMRPATAGTQS